MGKLTERQLKAIPHIVGSQTYSEGIKKAGISRKTFYEWMKDPVFERELTEQRKRITAEALGLLELSMNRAVEGLTGLLETQDERLRRLVSKDIIEHILKHKENEELEERIKAIEEKVAGGKRR
jgi:ACT domain-containing protein